MHSMNQRRALEIDKEKSNKEIDFVVEQIADTAQSNECFFVKEEMTDLIMFASGKLDSTDEFDMSLVPVDKGFAYFEKPIVYTTLRGDKCLVNMVAWKKVFLSDEEGTFGLFLSFWNDTYRTPDERTTNFLEHSTKEIKDFMSMSGRFMYIGHQFISHNVQVAEEVIPVSDEEIRTSLELEKQMLEKLKAEESLSESEESYKKELIENGGSSPEDFYPRTNLVRILWAYFLIMSQTLTDTTKHQAENRAQRKRMERENLPSDFVIVQFRKRRYLNAETDETKEESAVEWSHRWIVGGHWRWQPYKDPKSGGEIKKRIWISPYVKGPGDKPLIAKSRIFVLAK